MSLLIDKSFIPRLLPIPQTLSGTWGGALAPGVETEAGWRSGDAALGQLHPGAVCLDL